MEAVAVDNQLDLVRFEAKSFMGIDQSRPVVLDFTKFHKQKNITKFIGNQGTGKSSTLTALLYAVGAELDFKKDNIINLKDETVSLAFEFLKGGFRYRVRANKTKFTLEKFVDSEEVWIGQGEPKATLKKLLGGVATSPMFLKEMDGRDQITWFRKYFSREHEGSGRRPREERLLDELAEWTTNRTLANRDLEGHRKALESEEMYQKYEENKKRFQKPITVDNARERLEKANQQMQTLAAAEARMTNLDNMRINQLTRIQELEEEILRVKKEHKETLDSIEQGISWMNEHRVPWKEEYKEASEQYSNISKLAADYRRWAEILDKEKMMHDYEDLVQKADARKDEIREELLKLTKKYLPKIEGMELRISGGIDRQAEGVFLNGKTLAQISESELWEFFLQVCVHNKVNFVFIENVSSLGSNAIGVLNDLASKGVKIFCSEMDRRRQELKIVITDKLD